MALRIGLFSLAALLFGAHFLRYGNWLMVALCLAVPFGFVVRRRWSLYLLQLLAYCAAVTWVVLAVQLVELRLGFGQPWRLAAAILAAVASLTLFAGLLLNSRAMRRHYPE